MKLLHYSTCTWDTAHWSCTCSGCIAGLRGKANRAAIAVEARHLAPKTCNAKCISLPCALSKLKRFPRSVLYPCNAKSRCTVASAAEAIHPPGSAAPTTVSSGNQLRSEGSTAALAASSPGAGDGATSVPVRKTPVASVPLTPPARNLRRREAGGQYAPTARWSASSHR